MIQRKLKEQARWSEILTTVSNENLVESEALFKEKLELEKEWPIIFEKMQAMEPEIRAAYQEFILAKECSFEAKKVLDAQEHLRQLKLSRDRLKHSHGIRNQEINALLGKLVTPVKQEAVQILFSEINNLATRRIFVQIGEELYENNFGWFRKPVVRNNLKELEQAEELLLAAQQKIREQSFCSVCQILDILDQVQDVYSGIDFLKCGKDEFFQDDFRRIVRTQGETPSEVERIWPWEIKPRAEETRIFDKEIVVNEKVAKVFGK